MKSKRPSESALVDQEILITPSDLNSNWKMRGGRLFDLIDLKAAIVARNHSGHICNTVAGSSFKYFSPINTAQQIIIDAKITKSWNTSMEVRVDAYSRNFDGEKKHAFGIYLYFVAEEDDVLQQVPKVIPRTQEEKNEYKGADSRIEEVKEFIEKYIEEKSPSA